MIDRLDLDNYVSPQYDVCLGECNRLLVQSAAWQSMTNAEREESKAEGYCEAYGVTGLCLMEQRRNYQRTPESLAKKRESDRLRRLRIRAAGGPTPAQLEARRAANRRYENRRQERLRAERAAKAAA